VHEYNIFCFIVSSVIWTGGVIGGRVVVSITSSLLATGPVLKTLRYGSVLVVQQEAMLTWRQGNISLADGANITVYGSLLVNNTGKSRVFIGEKFAYSAIICINII